MGTLTIREKHFLTICAEEFEGTMSERCEYLYQVHHGAVKGLLLMVSLNEITTEQYVEKTLALSNELEIAMDIAIELAVS